jgi:putative membrane protein
MLEPIIARNDRKAKLLIIVFSAVVFSAILVLGRIQLSTSPGFDIHIFARINALINSVVAVLLLLALYTVRSRQYLLHRNLMIAAMLLSILFLLSYIAHHLFAGETRFGDVDHDGIVSEMEKASVGKMRVVYYILLGTHIPLAGIILPFILFSAYRGLTGEFAKHRKLVRFTWPIWFYVAVTGVLVYLLISPYYG